MSSPSRRLSLLYGEIDASAVNDDSAPLVELGTRIYRQPYEAPLSMWAFPARVALALCEHAWRPTQDQNRLHVVFTPALADGEEQVVAETDGYREVRVGLDPGDWDACTIADKRRRLVAIAVRHLEPVQSAWSLDPERLRRAAREVVDGYDTIIAVVGDPAAASIGPELSRQLELETWTALAADQRLAIGREVAERTRKAGKDIGEPMLVESPDHGPVVVAPGASDLPMVLIPGGRMSRGFGALSLARLDRIHEKLWYYEGEPGMTRRFPRELTPFGADASCRVDSSEQVDIGPMWVARHFCDVDDEPAPWDRDEPEHDGPPATTWRRALEVLAQTRWTLPTSDELLWVASAGDGRLFPWGDDPSPIGNLLDADAAALAEAYGVEVEPAAAPKEDPFERFAAPNPFGIAGALSHGTWCLPIRDLNEPAPLVIVGGGLDGYPWQGGWEAMRFLTRVISRLAFDGRMGAQRASIRPIIRLSS